MGRRRQSKPSGRIAQSAEAMRLLKGDTPEAIKIQLRLAVKGGRQQRRRCLGCGKGAVIHCKVWTVPDAWKIEAQGDEGMRVYWLCQPCEVRFDASGLPPEIERKLQG